MVGDTLYPLNELKKTHSDLYEQKVSKYIGREKVMKQVIPILDCLWNDVLHFTAVHPKDVKEALIKAGSRKDFEMKCYEIKPELLNPKNTIVYLYEKDYISNKMDIENFTTYNPDEIQKYSTIPKITTDYYKESYDKGEKPLVFHGVPHILYKGNLNVKNLEVIKV